MVPGGVEQDILCEKINEFQIEEDVTDTNIHELAFNEFYDISCDSFKDMIDIKVKSMSITFDEIYAVEELTRGQSLLPEWWEIRKECFTASNFYLAAVNKVEPSNKLKFILYSSFSNASTLHGNQNESIALQKYVQFLTSKSININVKKVGLLLSKSHPYLGASLDAVIKNVDSGERWGVEIKCPFSKFSQNIDLVVSDKKFYLQKKDNNISLKKSHKYFYQIQGQMFCSNLNRVDLVVWFGNDKPLFVETVTFDDKFWKSTLSRIEFFYC